MRWTLLFCMALSFCSSPSKPGVVVQEKEEKGNWDVYMTGFEKGPGSVVLNMDLKKVAPDKARPYLLVAGVKCKDCAEDGLPAKREYDVLYAISDSVEAALQQVVKYTMAGSFTYQCQRVDYFYLPDTTGVRAQITALHERAFPDYEFVIGIKPDPAWDAYLNYLYPTEDIQDRMSNQKLVMQLQEAGDKLDRARQIDHWIYFDSEKDRACFVLYAVKNKFRIEGQEKEVAAKRPYTLHISRKDMITLEGINELTTALRKQAADCNGSYDGWESIVLKD